MKSNEKVIGIGEKIGYDRFYLLNFDKLCLSPKDEIIKLTNFLGIKIDICMLNKLSGIPVMPRRSGQYKNEMLDWLNEKDKNFLNSYDFPIQ